MKRLMLRVGVLVTLVGLGVFAIAQAQRSSSPSPGEEAMASPLKATAGEPKFLPDTAQSAKPIEDLTKPRLAPEAASRLLAASAAEPALVNADPFARPTNHVVRAVGTTNEPVIVQNVATSAPAIRSELGEPAKTNPLRDPTLAVNVEPSAAPVATPTPAVPVRVPTRLVIGESSPSTAPAAEPMALAAEPMTPSVAPQQVLAPPTSATPLAAAPANSAFTPSAPAQMAPLASVPTTRSITVEPAQPVDAFTSRSVSATPDHREPARLEPDQSASSSRMLSSSREARSAAEPMPGTEGTGQPGQKQLEGPQTPQLTIQKFAPQAVQVGVPATFRITVVNTGPVAAHGVEIRDEVPRGMQLLSSKPQASRGAGGEVLWDLGTVKPGDEVSAELLLMPVAQGELGSVATVRFNAEASARTTATKPELSVKTTLPKRVMIGEEALLTIDVSNPGTGVATGVVLTEAVPAGFQHQAGSELEYKIGTLKPGETRQVQLSLAAARAGKFTNLLVAEGEASLRAEDRAEVEIIAPAIDVAMDGPKRRFLEREATYTVSVVNNGTAPARQVELVAYLPRGLKFVSANNSGQYDSSTQSVHWLLAELPANDAGKVELVTMPVEAGQQKLRLSGKAERSEPVEAEHPVLVEGIAAIMFSVVDVQDPIEKDGETTYDIRVVNQGSKAATNVRIAALLPPGLKALAAEGPTRYSLETNRVQFDGLARLAPKAESTFRVRVQGLQPGDQRIRVQLITDEMQEPVTKEESTRVYTDE